MDRRGFTILEVLVALTITALCLALVSISLNTAFKANERAREHLELEQTMNETLTMMRHYLQAAYLSPFGEGTSTSFETMDINSLSSPYDALTFTTLAHETHKINAKEADMIAVTFFTDNERPMPSADGELQLRRLRLRAGGEINDKFEVEGGTLYTLADHVTTLEFQYLDPIGEWRPEWIPWDHENNLPCMIRVKLGMRTANLGEEQASILVPLQMTRLQCRFQDDRVFRQ